MRAQVAGVMLAAISTAALAQAGGADTFEDRCSMCHVIGASGQGPNLKGVVGRKAGSLPGFAYSAALKSSGLTWTAANLDKFLTNPAVLVPGTAMMVRINDTTQRAAIIRYLAAQK